ncbi:MAG TPA: AAA family ATPase [Candidatus Nanoarchaeia archaeon]|nr:AAA family ATPase [Candidatus Nanoarchaeia archaeon]
MIIGLTGTYGSGKNKVVEYFVKKGFNHYSVRSFIEEKLKQENKPLDRDNLIEKGNELRKNQGNDFLVREIYNNSKGEDIVIESLRNPEEILYLRNFNDFYMIAVDANLEERYKRIKKRKSDSDFIGFDKFKNDELREMSSKNKSNQNLEKCMEMADFNIKNNGTEKELYDNLESLFKK